MAIVVPPMVLPTVCDLVFWEQFLSCSSLLEKSCWYSSSLPKCEDGNWAEDNLEGCSAKWGPLGNCAETNLVNKMPAPSIKAGRMPQPWPLVHLLQSEWLLLRLHSWWRTRRPPSLWCEPYYSRSWKTDFPRWQSYLPTTEPWF